MTERERAINQELMRLGEAYRFGRMTREDYRARRRRLLGAAVGGVEVTARNILVSQTAPTQHPRQMHMTQPRPAFRTTTLSRSSPRIAWKELSLFAAGITVILVLILLLLLVT